jgi:hypothetical protein
MTMRRAMLAAAAAFALAVPAAASAQGLADYDYENLSFRGIGFEGGYIWPNKVEPTPTYGARIDLGYLGPGLRVTPSVTWWSSRMKRAQVAVLEGRVDSLVARQGGGTVPPVSLGTIDWTDLDVALDAHVVWRVPYGFLTFLGAGASVHVLNGDGAAINGTFVEDLLDSVSAGLALQTGVEYPVHRHIRLYASGRLELLEDLRYAAARGGLQILLGGPAPGEERGGR